MNKSTINKMGPRFFDHIIQSTLNDEFRGISSSYPNKKLYPVLSNPDNIVKKAWKGYKGSINLYIHIPFCEHKKPPLGIPNKIWDTSSCGFCNFFKTEVNENYKISDFVFDLKKEITLYKQLSLKESCVLSSIFFGGGTPSLLSAEQYFSIFESIQSTFGGIEDNTEICIEVSPDTVPSSAVAGRDKLKKYFEVGFNRISFGTQTFNPGELKLIPRYSTVDHLENVVKWAKEVGFKNINIDLIVGLPKQNKKSLSNSIKKTINLSIPMISIFPCQIRKNTNFYQCQRHKVIEFLTNSEVTKLYKLAKKQLKKEGYKPSFSTTWNKDGSHKPIKEKDLSQMIPELGLGPGANTKGLYTHYTCGYECNNDISNLQHILNWSNKLRNNNFPATHGFELNEDEIKRKYISYNLSTPKGINIQDYISRFKEHPFREFGEQFKALNKYNLIGISKKNIKFNELGLDFRRPLLVIFYSQMVLNLYRDKINFRLT